MPIKLKKKTICFDCKPLDVFKTLAYGKIYQSNVSKFVVYFKI